MATKFGPVIYHSLRKIIFSHYISDAAAKKRSKLPPAFRMGLFLLFMVCNDHLDNGFVTLKTITTCLRCWLHQKCVFIRLLCWRIIFLINWSGQNLIIDFRQWQAYFCIFCTFTYVWKRVFYKASEKTVIRENGNVAF